MITLRKAAERALEALEWHYRQGHSDTLGGFRLKVDQKTIRDLRAALEQPEQKPVAWCDCEPTLCHSRAGRCRWQAMPHRREWQGLTDEEIDELSQMVKGDRSVNWLSRTIEAALKGKNHG